MSNQSPIDLDLIQELLAQPDRTPRSRKPKDVREYDYWFKLEHIIMGTCSNTNCSSPTGPNRVTAIVNEHEMCRFCFLDRWHYYGD